MLEEDFLMKNNVAIKYNSQTHSILVHVNNDQVLLLTDQLEGNLKNYYPSTFLTGTAVTQNQEKLRVSPSNTVSPYEIVSTQPTDNFDPAQQDNIDLFPLEK